MSNKQQTAVEQFWDKIALKLSVEQVLEFMPLLEQAREMDKERIKKAWVDGNYNTDDDGNPSENYSICDEHYYEQTYGGN